MGHCRESKQNIKQLKKKKEYLLTNIRKMPKIKQLIKSFFRDLKNLDFEMFRSMF